MDETRTIHTRHDGGVLWITLARPQQLNAINQDLVADLGAVLTRAAADPPRVLVLSGSGRAFCAGADLKAVRSVLAPHPEGCNGERTALPGFLGDLVELLSDLETLPCPTIAMINGIAVAGGLELMLACDLAIAARSAVLCDGHARYGLTPGGGATQRLPRTIGLRRALHMLLTGGSVSADEALAMGLVNVVVNDHELETKTAEVAADLAGRSPTGAASIKRLARLSLDVPLAEGLLAERRDAATRLFSADVSEGLAAFAEGRAPAFS